MAQNSLACGFPGQGIQSPHMAKAIQGTAAWRLFREASDILGYDLGTLCLEGPEERLNNTAYAQVAIFVTCYALWELSKDQYSPDFFLGHSLGEITALAVAGAFSFAAGVELVKTRGNLMARSSQTGGMAAILGLDLDVIQELCAEVSATSFVQVANENSPQQTVVSGENEALELLGSLAQARGAKRVVRLNVSGPFHSGLMEPVADKFKEVVRDLRIEPCQTPVLSNDGQTLLQDPAEIRGTLVGQLTKPVRFTSQVRKLVELGVESFVEVSPQPLLGPLARRIEPKLQISLVRDGGM